MVAYQYAIEYHAHVDIRKIINRAAVARGMNRYQVWKACDGEVSKTAVYQFLDGKTSMSSDQLGHVLNAVGITLYTSDDKAAKEGK